MGLVAADAHPETDLADTAEYEVRVYDTRRNRRLAAAVELISPSNKDRPEARPQFVSKCAALLRQSVSVVLVDVVATRSFDLYAELLRWVGGRDPSLGEPPPATYAAACRWRPVGARMTLEAWGRPLAVGDPLPTLPLWLAEDLAVPLDLEASYEQTCRDLQIARASRAAARHGSPRAAGLGRRPNRPVAGDDRRPEPAGDDRDQTVVHLRNCCEFAEPPDVIDRQRLVPVRTRTR